MAIIARETEFGGKLRTDGFAEEEGGRAAALLIKRHLKGAADGVFAAVGEAGEEDRKTLLVARGVRLAEDSDNFRVREPFGNGGTEPETTAEL